MNKHFSLITGKLEQCNAENPASCPLIRQLEKITGSTIEPSQIHGEHAQLYVENLLASDSTLKNTHSLSPFYSAVDGALPDKEAAIQDNRQTRTSYDRVFRDQNYKTIPMSRNEDRALGAYKWSGYGWMNRYLRGDATVTEESLGMGESLTMVDSLNELIHRQPKTSEEIVVYRAGGFPELKELPAEISADNPVEVTLDGFVSTSVSGQIFRKFQKKTRWAITIPSGSSVLPVENFSVGGAALKAEWEVLFPHHSRLELTSKKEVNGYTLLEAKLIQ